MGSRVLVASIATLLAAAPAIAQSVVPGSDEGDADFSFGASTQEPVVPASLCQETSATPRFIEGNFQFFGSENASERAVTCPVTLPHGARVTGMECIVRDHSAVGDVLVDLVRWDFDPATALPSAGTVLASVASTGISGYQVLSTTLATPVTIRRRVGGLRGVHSLLVSLPPDVVGNGRDQGLRHPVEPPGRSGAGHRDVHGRPGRPPAAPVRGGSCRRRHHRGMRAFRVLPGQPADARPDGRLPGRGSRAPLPELISEA